MLSRKLSRRQRALARPGRKLLGLDLGERRVGVAISDDIGIFASPSETIDLRHTTLRRVAELVERHGVAGIVVGLPSTMGGEEGFQARETRAMAAEIEALVDVPIRFWDERLTSAIADQLMYQNRRAKRRKKEERDAIAAAVMLQGYLDAHPIGDGASGSD
jgi:putative Holliday junction resolvase